MLIRIPRSWELPEREATPEGALLDRRAFLAGSAALGLTIARPVRAQQGAPARNPAFTLDRAVTPESVSTRHNNYFDFGATKRIFAAAEALQTSPWKVRIDGLIDNPGEMDLDDLVRVMPVEERLYRHRCVETWAMAIPWTGFPLAALVKRAQPKPDAKFVVLTSFHDPKVAPTQRQTWYPWPYREALTLDEATNDLAFMVTGAYGKPLAKSLGAPIRLAVPWKYGFKSAKAITRVSFVARRPQTFWEIVQGDEYGFWANVNPEAPHVRWSQAEDRLIGSNEIRPTKLFNGYAEQVAGLYRGLEGEKLWM
jgi:sulfoxide reductase catalytic subunit YedY